MFGRLGDFSLFVHSRDTRPSTSTGPTASRSPSANACYRISSNAEREHAPSELALQAGSAKLQARKHVLLPETVSDICIARSSHRWQSPGRKPLGWQSHQPHKLVTKTAELRDATQRHVTRPARRPRQRIENGATRREAIAEGRQVPAVREAMRSPGANMSKHTCLQAATSEGVRLRSRLVSSLNVDRRSQAG